MLTFNNSGLLVTDYTISSTLKEIETVFVNEIPSNKRKMLFDKLIIYNNELKSNCELMELHQWIDGSFITKKRNPSDIDFITFISSEKLEQLGNKIDDFKFPNSEKKFVVDAYIVEVYSDFHRYKIRTVLDKAYWMGRFTKTRRNRAGNKFTKGFLEVYS